MRYTIQTPSQLSPHLRGLRRARGLSQSQLGALLGVGQSRIARIERDPASVSAEQLLRVLSALGARMELVQPEDHPASETSTAATDTDW